jgi:uncharacterized protein with ParB-like and HNH nuclease domain
LIDDLLAYQQAEDPVAAITWALCCCIRHAGKEKRFIIDGQQRLTALCVLYQFLINRLPW